MVSGLHQLVHSRFLVFKIKLKHHHSCFVIFKHHFKYLCVRNLAKSQANPGQKPTQITCENRLAPRYPPARFTGLRRFASRYDRFRSRVRVSATSHREPTAPRRPLATGNQMPRRRAEIPARGKRHSACGTRPGILADGATVELGSFMVELFTAARFSRGLRSKHPGSSCCDGTGSPRRDWLNERVSPESPAVDLWPLVTHQLQA